jgi:hypothetical protein
MHAWSPAEGPEAAPQQIPHRSGYVSGSGDDSRTPGSGLWAPSSGPARTDPGGPGGEPDGRTVPRPGRTALNED